MKITNDKFLREKENKIKFLLSQKEISYLNAFNFLYKHYSLKNLTGKAPILHVFEAIYVKKINLPALKLAIYCNVSRSTLFAYRNIIIKDFNVCLSANLFNQEVASTKGDNI